jgi:hypothetical protein
VDVCERRRRMGRMGMMGMMGFESVGFRGLE